MPDRPQDVPDDLLLVALSAWTGKTLRSLYDLIEVDGDEHGAMERTLRALLPAHERQVRERVAEQIEARGDELRGDKEHPISREEWACFTISARVARGES